MSIRDNLKAIANVKYNEKNDFIQVAKDGVWFDAIYAGVQWDGYIFKDGNVYEEITGGYEVSTNGGNSYALTIGSELLFARTGNYANDYTGIFNTIKKIDTSNFTKMRVVGTVYSKDTNTYGFTCSLGLSASKSKATTASFTVLANGDNNPGVAFDKVIDISTLNDEYYFTIHHNSISLGGIKINSIKFYN